MSSGRLRTVQYFIATADWHLRPDTPVCRTDDWLDIQRRTMEAIAGFAREYSAVILNGGDLCHRASIPDWLKREVVEIFRGVPMVSVVGNHDVNYDISSKVNRVSLGVLVSAGMLELVSGEPVVCNGLRICGVPCDGKWEDVPEGVDIVLAHKFVYKRKPPFPGAEKSGPNISRKIPIDGVPLVVTGDNHQRFDRNSDVVTWINPGCVTRQRSDLGTFCPSFHLVKMVDGCVESVEVISLPDDKEDAVTDKHVEVEVERGERFDALTERLSSPERLSISFENNLQSYINGNRLRKSTRVALNGEMNEIQKEMVT